MDVSQAAFQLLADHRFVKGLPSETIEVLQAGSNKQYLDTLAHLALQASHTAAIFSWHNALSIELCSRWLTDPIISSNPVVVFAALARVLPVAPYLSPYVKRLFHLSDEGPLAALTSHGITAILEIADDVLQHMLLALYRLLRFNNEAFAHLVSPAQLQLLISHSSRPVRYLAIRIFCLYLHASEAALEETVGRYLGREQIHGQWEDKIIDYTFLNLWEVKRLEDLRRNLEHALEKQVLAEPWPSARRIIRHQDFSPSTVCLAGVLLPNFASTSTSTSFLVMTHTVRNNMESLAKAIRSDNPVLLTGPLGAGKTSLVSDAARQLGCAEQMIVLHLNEQTDAKLLIGMYTTAGGPGSFCWEPGLLTKAVIEGRWVLIEDFDRAPAGIISTLLPLLDRRELLVPHWGQTVRAAPGFKLIATVCSSSNGTGEGSLIRSVIGARYWDQVKVLTPPVEELEEIMTRKFPLLHAYRPKLMGLYSWLLEAKASSLAQAKVVNRSCSPQDLFRWTSRINDLLQGIGGKSGNEPIPETGEDSIFLEGIDCFAGSLPDSAVKEQVVALVARELHISRERIAFCLNARKPEYSKTENVLRIGRTCLSIRRNRALRPQSRKYKPSPFAATNLVLRQLESIAMAIKMAEPCLLVGETGTGKTTMVQQLAESLDRKLVVINLSQQSEVGDLLGGFKPVNMGALAIPMKEEFEILFENTFSSNRNQRYIEHVAKAISKNRWSRALTLWREAAKMVEATFMSRKTRTQHVAEEPSTKKRKLDSQRLQSLRKRWEFFANQLETFQKHLESGSKGFAFSFVEGNLVKAARNGDWVLLDEINLAAPDTLDSLADLLTHGSDGSPSILLTETGETERIQAHKDFRIFAAMNPANDIGKRDLPLSLRSRFFELFIESPDKHIDNLVPLVQAYLNSHTHNDVRVAGDVAQLYLEIQKLASENRLADGADHKPHYSLRTLTRTLVYVNDIAPIYGLRRGLFEGFSMSFLTLLNQASCLLVLPLMERFLLGSQKNSRTLLLQTPKLPRDAGAFVKFKQYWMAKGQLPIQNHAHYIITPFIEKNLLNLVRATSTRRFPVLLQGPTSSGKTSMVEYLANMSGHKFVRINNHEHTDLQEYLGTYISGNDGQLQYQEGILVQALREGFWIVLDELNLAPTDVLEALNRLLDDNRELFIPETQQIVRPHQEFMLFATQNPPGVYGGRKILSRAFRNRFLELHFDDIPEDELEVILRERSQIAPSFCAKIVAVYKRLSLHRQHSRLFEQKNSFGTLRDLFRWAFRDADDREQLAVNGYYLLAERVRDDIERQVVQDTIEEVMKTKINDDKIYSIQKLPSSLRLSSTANGIVWTKSMRRLYVLVTEALEKREPVLLVGETGSGKTTICQVIAEIMHNHLHIVNAHQNMETGDLIGSQRPMRSRHLIEARLHAELCKVFSKLPEVGNSGDSSLRQLITAYQDLPKSTLEIIPLETKKDLEECFSHYHALFEWVDGSLVHAMKAGQHFLLDEISLADDSVLERLNSVLEPGRRLFLAEKGVNDALVVATEGFQFLATMNPGGDYGKKELSPALRNRFTEIWVPHASDQQEMEEILEAKLGQSQAHLAPPMVAFAHWYGSNLSSTEPVVSIRDLLAWIAFLKTGCISDAHRSVLHGAALVYIDTLGANPAAKLQIAGLTVQKQRELCLDKLSKLFQCDMTRAYREPIELGIGDKEITLGPFALKRHASTTLDPAYSLQAPTTLRNALKIARALQLPRPILVEGSPGVGKTTLVAALAQACGMPLTRINLSDQTDLMDLFGSDVPVEGGVAGQFQWCEAPFLRAMQNGEWVLLDEMNLASQNVLEGLNACFDHRGQVYISELDQTFARHPNFVVFAAQNPHQQGSGRKGLPASFVNRFTVVYADIFSADDLLMICSKKFPNVPIGDIKELTKCVESLDAAVQEDGRLGVSGRPWEINLRDTTRWLDLLHSQDGLLRAARPEDFAAMLFLQRFRTPEDNAAVSSLLNSHLPQSVGSNYRVFGVSTNHIQIGLGLLSCQTFSLSDSKRRILPSSHLPHVESVLFCVQKSWPCLLTGPSGSGKRNMIRHLASSTGADLVELSMNADMDTTDMVGGYEQLDSQREHAVFVARLRAFAKNITLQRLQSMQEGSKFITELETCLSAGQADLEKIVELLRNAADELPEMDFDTYLHEGEAIMNKPLHNNRARFEWVDGILIRAVVEGKWLVLDNANLCSPSVLDRLNSLLEPNGVLNINERHLEDGSVRVVKPHPNFRLFMTMDPQHGELSRAMRNRNVELFIHMAENGHDDGISLMFDPTMIRFEQFQRICSLSAEGRTFHDLIWLCLDHLTFSDLSLVKFWSEQVSAGLIEMSSQLSHSFLSTVKLFGQVLASGGNVVQNIKEMYSKISRYLSLPLGFEDAQTIQPLNNPVLLNLEHQTNASSFLLRLGMSLDLLIRVTRLEKKFESIGNHVGDQSQIQLSQFQTSTVRTKSRRVREASTDPLAPFLAEGIRALRLALERTDPAEYINVKEALPHRTGETDMSGLEECFSFFSDLTDIARSTDFDEAEFQVYLSLGQDLSNMLHSDTRTKGLALALKKRLDSFDKTWQLKSGQSMDLIWSRTRPPIPITFEQLEWKLQVEQVAERFDRLTWTSDVPMNRLDEMRQIIAQMGKVTPASLEITSDDVEGITDALRDLEVRQDVLVGSTIPYMQPEFEALRQYKAASVGIEAAEDQRMLGLLAGEPTKPLIEQGNVSPGWRLFSYITIVTGVNYGDIALATLRGSLPICVLEKLSNVAEVPLKGLDLLREEVMQMASNTAQLTAAICEKHQPVLHDFLKRLHREMAHAHSSYLQKDVFDENSKSSSRPTLWLLGKEFPPSHYLRNIVQTYFQPSWDLMAHHDDQRPLTNTASAWILFFTGCLKLYIPDHPFDPALKPLVVRDRHRKRRRELRTQLSALRHFEQVTTGQSTNFRCQLLENQLEALGKEPAIDPVLRPRTSELKQLQGAFNNTLRSIVERLPEPSGLAGLFSGDLSLNKEIKVLRSNITQAVSHLRQGFRTYDDITKPLVAMLHGLDAGLAMAQIAVAPEDKGFSTIENICRYTPFFGMRLESPSQENLDGFGSIREDYYDSRLKYLESYTVMYGMSNNFGPAALTAVFTIFHNIYEDWKKQLSEDQQKRLAKSSMYRYRGGEADTDAKEEEGFRELFPDYEAMEVQPVTDTKQRIDPAELAQRLARHQRQLFEPDQDPVNRVMDLMRSSSADIARVWHNDPSISKSPLPPQNFLCGLVLKLDDLTECLNQGPQTSALVNFYTDPNLQEARELVSLVRLLQTRFFELKQAWPEHSILDDVLRTSSDLLALRHIEPTAKLITKVEKLHGYVHEWQTIASREYSAASLYEQLTSLLTGWRRLELATWSRLFDMEDKRCETEVDSWWFIAYEALVAAPLSILESEADLNKYAEELFATLQGFVIDTAIGHFSLRVRLLETFKKYLGLVQQIIPRFETVYNTLSNFLAFYSWYASPIQRHLQTGRLALEKEMKDIILLASWKDTNVNALRESAKRSHHKLFKAVREYRALLARPAQTVIEEGFPEYIHKPAAISVVSRNQRNHINDNPLPKLQDLPYDWSERPARFKDIHYTVSNMVTMSQMHPFTAGIPSILENYIEKLSKDVELLRKETPATATDDNVELLRYLTTRKRKLLSNTLKTVRHMGFRTNLSANVLSRQASLATVLPRMPPTDATSGLGIFNTSEYYMHHLLNLMPMVREAPRTHSEDLNGAEVARCVGYLESMLSLAVKQRILSGDFVGRLANLDQTVEKMQNLRKPEGYSVVPQTLERDDVKRIQRTLSCLPHIINTGCLIIEKHGKSGKLDHAKIYKWLQEWNTKFRNIALVIEAEPALPDKLMCSQHQSRYVDAQSLVKSFKDDLNQQIIEHPGLAFVLEQIALWTSTSPHLANGHDSHDMSLSVKDFDRKLMKTYDTIFVAMQAFERTTSTISSMEDPNWLVQSEKALTDGVKALHVGELSILIEETMTKLSRLNREDLQMAIALVAIALPIVIQYRDICHDLLDHLAARSRALNRMAATLADQFSKLASRGFCNPSQSNPTEAGKNERLEEGTGLGGGEGAEDISKDIQEDEDLSELAQEGQKSKEGEEISDQEDAVNMDQDELEGQMGDAQARDDEKGETSEAGSGDDNIDEETGDVDDLDPNAVDEKLWDDDNKQSDKEKPGSKLKGTGTKDDQPNAEIDQINPEEGVEEELSDAGAEEGEEVAQQEAETMDLRAQQEENLDLPEEMDFDGQEKSLGMSDLEDDDLDGLSNAVSEGDQVFDGAMSDEEMNDEEGSREEQGIQDDQNGDETEKLDINKADEAASPVDTEPEHDTDVVDGLLQNHVEDASVDEDTIAPSDAQGLEGRDADENADTQMQDNKAAGSTSTANEHANAERAQAPANTSELGNLQDNAKDTSKERDPTYEDYTNRAFKKLGDALERWHRQQKEIQDAQSPLDPEQSTADVDTTDPEFQHLENEGMEADTQALGAATEDQAHTLDLRALDSEMQHQPMDFLPDEVEEKQVEDTLMEDAGPHEVTAENEHEQPRPSTFIGEKAQQRQTPDQQSKPLLKESDLLDLPTSLSTTHLHPPSPSLPRSLISAQNLWSHHSSSTHSLSLTLTEQLRLTLSPTLATKMRGDFRTGKRLNIKRIIPYIASQYKRDKIWMRRSVPHKRNYQIMLAIDDSKSMAEGGSGELAFETLALVASSLSMLEVGEICVVGFGEEVVVAHPFGTPFSSEAGVNVFRHFGFQQQRTDIRKLVAEAISLFRNARQASLAANAAEIWQLMFIVSDGVCEDHDSIRRLVRQAQEERILIVFVIVDKVREEGGGSIVDMNEAVWEEVPVVGEEGQGGERKLVVRRYLDGFPFGYYVVVGDVRELPGVLGQALREWFGEVVGTE
ncbi:MAG: hypothetical protein Q9225_001794 [Loekoesia sp. 1 TL-2023]